MNAILAGLPINSGACLDDEPLTAITSEPTIGEIKARVEAALSRMGADAGRFALTYSVGRDIECYATHWFRPTPYAFEDCRTVGSGTVADCLLAIEDYAADYRADHRPMSGADLGLEAA